MGIMWADVSTAELRSHLKEARRMPDAFHPAYVPFVTLQLELRKQKRQELGERAYKRYMKELADNLPPDHISFYISCSGPVLRGVEELDRL